MPINYHPEIIYVGLYFMGGVNQIVANGVFPNGTATFAFAYGNTVAEVVAIVRTNHRYDHLPIIDKRRNGHTIVAEPVQETSEDKQ